jgi:hypothetical protein
VAWDVELVHVLSFVEHAQRCLDVPREMAARCVWVVAQPHGFVHPCFPRPPHDDAKSLYVMVRLKSKMRQ